MRKMKPFDPFTEALRAYQADLKASLIFPLSQDRAMAILDDIMTRKTQMLRCHLLTAMKGRMENEAERRRALLLAQEAETYPDDWVAARWLGQAAALLGEGETRTNLLKAMDRRYFAATGHRRTTPVAQPHTPKSTLRNRRPNALRREKG